MDSFQTRVHTGYPGLDEALLHVRLGDNVVFQIDAISSYRLMVQRFVRQAWQENRQVVYFRFAAHEPLIGGPEPQPQDLTPPGARLSTVELNAADGFESFVGTVYQTASRFGLQVFYVFDCLSDLLVDWASDLMTGNFFQIICPYLFELETVAYFGLLRGRHTSDTVSRIRETTQLFLNLYAYGGQLYIHPLKVWNRTTPTMYLPHVLTGESCRPITNSSDVSDLYLRLGMDSLARDSQKDYWDRLFDQAREQIMTDSEDAGAGSAGPGANAAGLFGRLLLLLFGKRTRLSQLLQAYLSLSDLVAIHRRQIGSGQIGGKAAGLLLARKILEKQADPAVSERFEPHDSFYLGSDLFYTYIVYNGWWQLYMEQKTPEGYFSCGRSLQEKMLAGHFPERFRSLFRQMLDYFGQAPIIVRSSSLLEDDFGHAFAGKYESIFCVNQGSPEDRCREFEQAVRGVYASLMNESALAYRLSKNLNRQDEQMALLVQRVSGDEHGGYFYPSLAGVGYSKNIYLWHKDLDPDAGMLRLVYGLGTRAVDRVDGDYPRLVSLDRPFLTPYHGADDERKYTQRLVDLLNLASNRKETLEISQLAAGGGESNLARFAEIDREGSRMARQLGLKIKDSWILNFKPILQQGKLARDFQQVLRTLAGAYGCPVDIEFTVNFSADGSFRMNLLQCRPLQIKGSQARIPMPPAAAGQDIVIRTGGEFMGGNIQTDIHAVIFVVASAYSQLGLQDKYLTARAIGRLNRMLADQSDRRIMLVGPGRWGTTTPSLGVPVSFAEIDRIAVLAEYNFASAAMRTELSFGSHFFQDLVEADIFYLAVPDQDGRSFMAENLILGRRNLLADFLPEYSVLAPVIHVSRYMDRELMLQADAGESRLTCWLNRG